MLFVFQTNATFTFRLLFIEQEQPPEVFYQKSCSLKFRKFNGKAPVLESLFDKIAGLRTCNFSKNRLQHRFFSCEICEIFKNPYFEEDLRTTAFDRWLKNVKCIKNSSYLPFSWRRSLSYRNHSIDLLCK